jgi:hypothetical protein
MIGQARTARPSIMLNGKVTSGSLRLIFFTQFAVPRIGDVVAICKMANGTSSTSCLAASI